MDGYPQAAKGLGKMFLAEILMMVGVLTILLGIGVIFSLVGQVVYLMGLYQARQDNPLYGSAFSLTIVGLVVRFLTGLLGWSLLGSLLDLLASILSFGVLYLICSATGMLLASLGQGGLARLGHTVWTVNLACTLVGMALSLLVIFPVINLLMIPGVVLIALAELVGGVLFLIFLYKASKALA